MKRQANNLFLCFFLAGIFCVALYAQNKSSESIQVDPDNKRHGGNSHKVDLSTLTAKPPEKYVHNYLIGRNPGVRNNHKIILSPRMGKALEQYESTFRAVTVEEVPWCIRKIYSFTKEQTPYVVFGDFNGDKKKDVVLMGHSAINALIVVVLSGGDQYKVIEITKNELRNSKEDCIDTESAKPKCCGIWSFLSKAPKGRKIKEYPAWKRPEINLATDAFEMENFEKSSAIFVYKNGKFVSYTMSD